VTLVKDHRHGVQLVFCSATISDDVEALVRQVLQTQREQNYVRIDVRGDESKENGSAASSSFSLNSLVQHQVRWAEDKAKKKELFTFLKGKREEATVRESEPRESFLLLAAYCASCVVLR
jgi:superfamily II DNA/RNA helicase